MPPLRIGGISAGMTPMAELVRRRDPDRYFCTLFAPAARREALMTLYAYNDALAQAGERAREPGLALIRLQWWREVIEGARRRHEVAGPLGALIDEGCIPLALLASMIDAREQAIEAPDETDVEVMRKGPGALAQAAGAALGASSAEGAALAKLGIACGIAGTLRNGRLGAQPDARAIAAHRSAAIGLLGRKVRWRRGIVSAALPAVLARRDLQRREPVIGRGLADRLAILRAAATGMI